MPGTAGEDEELPAATGEYEEMPVAAGEEEKKTAGTGMAGEVGGVHINPNEDEQIDAGELQQQQLYGTAEKTHLGVDAESEGKDYEDPNKTKQDRRKGEKKRKRGELQQQLDGVEKAHLKISSQDPKQERKNEKKRKRREIQLEEERMNRIKTDLEVKKILVQPS